jgi:disulfide oxidoreductase YuzD
MEQEIKKGVIAKVFNFSQDLTEPNFRWNKGRSLIEWGDKNLYPQYILNLFNSMGSSRHKAIINKKVKLIAGNGIFEVQDEKLNTIIKNNKLEKQIKRAALDYELFNGFAFEVIWSNGGKEITNIQHIPFHKLRLGLVNDEVNTEHVWYSNDWEYYRRAENEPEMIPLYNGKRGGKQIFYYTEYNPQSNGLYPIVGYSSGVNWIDLHYRISTFHLAQVKNGYAPSFVLNFATGIPSEEEQDAFFKSFKRNFQGEEVAGKIIITYSEGKEQAPELIPVQLNDSDERFIMLSEQIAEEITTAHEVPAPLMILTPGKLSATDEREELLKEFQYTYIDQRQEAIEEALNEIFETIEIEEKIKLKTYMDARVVEAENNQTDEKVENATAAAQTTEEQINQDTE